MRRNDVRLTTILDGEYVSHFRLYEFENRDGLAMVHPSVLESLERVRADLLELKGENVWLIVTDGIRTQADNEALAEQFGWTDEDGAVSRTSKHLAEFGGIAVDLIAVVVSSRMRIPQSVLGAICKKYFDFVKDDYKDGHCHCDNRGVLKDK